MMSKGMPNAARPADPVKLLSGYGMALAGRSHIVATAGYFSRVKGSLFGFTKKGYRRKLHKDAGGKFGRKMPGQLPIEVDVAMRWRTFPFSNPIGIEAG